MGFLKKYSPPAAIVLCAVAFTHSTADGALTIRHCILGISALLMFLFVPKDYSVLKKLIFPAFGIYILWLALSLIHAVNKSETIYEITRALIFFVFFFIAVNAEKRPLIKILSILGLFLGVIGGVQSIIHFLRITGSQNNFVGMMCNKNLWSSALLLLLPFCMYGMRYGKYWKISGYVSTSLIIITVFSIMSRSVILALFAASFVSAVYIRRLRVAFAILFLSSLLFIALKPSALNTTSIQRRSEIWKSSARMALDYPVFGVGGGNFQIRLSEYPEGIKTKNIFTEVFFRQPHNDYAWVAAETGFPGLFFYMSIFGFALYYAIRQKNVLALAGLTIYMVDAFFSFPKERAFHSVMLMLYLALAVKDYHLPRKKLYVKSPFKIIIVVLLVLSCYVMYCRHSDAKLMLLAKHDKLDNSDYKKLSWFTTMDLTSTPVYFWKGFYNYANGNYEESQRDFERAHKANPNHLYVLNFLAITMAYNGGTEQATAYLNRANLIPGNRAVLKKIEAIAGKNNRHKRK